MASSRTVTIYTDGGCKPNPGPGGWGAVLIDGTTGQKRELSGSDPDTTNNRMELTAVIEALRALNCPCAVTLYTDSQYVKNGITTWLPKWVKQGWQRRGNQPVQNEDLWRILQDETARHQIDWKWVKGHAGHTYNERVDQLATAARELLTGPAAPSPTLPDFTPDYSIALRVSGGGKVGGWAVRLMSADAPDSTYSGSEPDANAYRLELVAALHALRLAPAGSAVMVYCPSNTLCDGMTGWVHGWQQRGWKTTSGSPVKHRELWEALIAAAGERRVLWAKKESEPPSLAAGLDQLAADAARGK